MLSEVGGEVNQNDPRGGEPYLRGKGGGGGGDGHADRKEDGGDPHPGGRRILAPGALSQAAGAGLVESIGLKGRGGAGPVRSAMYDDFKQVNRKKHTVCLINVTGQENHEFSFVSKPCIRKLSCMVRRNLS